MSEQVKSKDAANKVHFYKTAALPWFIIAFTLTLFIGVVVGWTMRSDQANVVNAKAETIVKNLSTDQSK